MIKVTLKHKLIILIKILIIFFATNIKSYAENPKVIASTATIQDAAEQILGLYNREAEIFPLDFTNPDDSFFSVKKYDSPGRIYIGLTSATANSPNYLLQSTMV